MQAELSASIGAGWQAVAY